MTVAEVFLESSHTSGTILEMETKIRNEVVERRSLIYHHLVEL